MTTSLIHYLVIDMLLFPTRNKTIGFSSVDYEAHEKAKLKSPVKHGFQTMSVKELITRNLCCAVERTQTLIMLAVSMQNQHCAGFFQRDIAVNFSLLKFLLPGILLFCVSFHHYKGLKNFWKDPGHVTVALWSIKTNI